MSVPALALAPVLIDPRTGTGANTETLDAQLLDRAARARLRPMARRDLLRPRLRPPDPAARHHPRHRPRHR